jgi:tetratricopeptide (TPR) repeat protein
MKKQNLRSYALIAVAAATTMACNPLNNMTKRAEEVSYSVTPDPLEMHADSIEVSISGTIPPKFFNKKVSVDITPVLNYQDSEASFEKITLVGEDSEVDGIKIAYEAGGNFSHVAKIPYQEGMDQAILNAVAVGRYGDKEKAFEPKQIATGTIITPMWVEEDYVFALGEDNFQKTYPKSNSAEINYLVNSANVRSSELRDEDMKALKDWINENADHPMFAFKGGEVVAYASPEGELSLNENLAEDRAKSGAAAVRNILKRAGEKEASGNEFFQLSPKGEDWDGFKRAMQASDIKDKDLILRVLEMYEDKAKREEEIRNLAETFEVLKDEILPGLRRSMITVNGEMTSFSDEKIMEFSKTNPDTLSSEELLYAATMTDDMDEKMRIYQKYSELFPEDWRGPNNVGYIMALNGDMESAKAEFDKAAGLDPENGVILNNMGVYAQANGDVDKAMEHYEQSNTSESGANAGAIYITRGEYAKAVNSFGTMKSFNSALAKTLNGDYQEAISTIDESPSAEKGKSKYLKAIIGARQGDKNAALTNLKAAIAMNDSWKEKAKVDAEFTAYFDDAEFQAVVN